MRPFFLPLLLLSLCAAPDVAAQIVPTPTEIEQTVEAGQTASVPISLGNTSGAAVDFSIRTTGAGGARLFGVGIFDDTIVELDPETGGVLSSFPTPAPAGVGAEALAFDGEALYYANSFVSNSVFKLDPATGTVLAAVEVGLSGVDALAHSGEALYALDYLEDAVYEIDLATGNTVRTIPLSFDAIGGLTWGGARGTLFVGGGDGVSTYEIDPTDGSVLNTLPVGGFFYGMGYSQALGVLFAFDASSNQLLTIDPNDGTVLSSRVPPVALSGLAADETPGASWLSVSPTEGQIPASGSASIEAMLDAADLIAGTYGAVIEVVVDDAVAASVPVTLAVTGEPEIAVAPPSLDFGGVFVGASATQPLTVSNTGTDSLFVSAITSSDPAVTADGDAFVIAPGRSRSVSVTFAPTTAGSVSAMLTIASNDVDEASLVVPVSGEGTPAPVLVVEPSSIEAEAESGEVVTTTLTISNPGGSALTFDVMPQNAVGRVSSRALGRTPRSTERSATSPRRATDRTLSRSSDRYRAPIYPSRRAADVLGFAPTPDAARRVVGPTTDALRGGTLPTLVTDPAGDGGAADLVAIRGSITPEGLTVEFETVAPVNLFEVFVFLALDTDQDPSTGFDFTEIFGSELGAEYGFQTEDGGNEGFEVLLFDFIEDEVIAETPLIVEGNTLRFSFPIELLPRLEGVADAIGITIEDLGDILDLAPDEGTFEFAAAPSWLSVAPGSGTVEAGASVEVTVTLDASELFAGTYEATLVVASNDPVTPSASVPVTFTVTGEPELDVPTALDFGTVFAGFPATRTLTVTNAGTDSLAVEVASSDPALSVVPGSFTVAPASARAVAIIVTPETTGAFSFTLTLATNDADEPTVEVVVTGTAAEAPVVAVAPASLAIQVETGATESTTLTISNGGGSPLDFALSAQRAALREGAGGRTAEARTWARTQAPTGFAVSSASRGELPLLYEDAVGDSEGAPDLVAVRGLATGTDLTLQLVVGGTLDANNFGGVIGFDVDEDPTTGEPLPFGLPGQDVGVEYIVDLFNLGSGEVILTDAFFNIIGFYAAVVEGSTATFSIPLVDLSDDGALTLAGVIGSFNGPTDWFPESGAIAVGNVSFLSFSPEASTVLGGESAEVMVTVDAADLAVGTYNVELIVATNDPATPMVVVPVTVDVVMGEAGESETEPVRFALHPLYPNPLRGRGAVAFDLPEAAAVTLDLFDVQGRRVATLARGERAPGRHTAALDATALPSGMYLCRLQAGSSVATTKVLIVQ